jgi:hypothetical protein
VPKLLIVWPKFADGDAFDADSLANHIPLVERLEGGPVETARVIGGRDHRITTVTFASMEQLRTAFRSPVSALTKADTERMRAAYERDPLLLIVE